MDWTEDLRLGLAPMDEVHEEFVELYNRLASADEAGFLAAMDAFIAHTVAHFEMENGWMAATGFPGCHKAEHDRVLTVMRDIRARVVAGDRVLGKRLVAELPAWFESHATGMDSALAYYLEQIKFDPVTFKAAGCVPAGSGGCGAAAPADPDPGQEAVGFSR